MHRCQAHGCCRRCAQAVESRYDIPYSISQWHCRSNDRDKLYVVDGEERTMKVKMILPALTEAISPYWRPIKYSLFPPLGLATLAGYLDPDLDIAIQDEHVEKLNLNDDPDLVVIQVYITNAYRAYQIADLYRARGAYVVLGGLHVTSLPDEAAQHADTIFIGPGEHTFPKFLQDLAEGTPKRRYGSSVR